MGKKHSSKTEVTPVQPVTPPEEGETSIETLLRGGSASTGVDWDWSRLPLSDGRYAIQSPLPHGGQGDLFLALDKLLGRQVAIKVLRPEQLREKSIVDRFLQEARIHSQFHHFGIPPLHDVGRLADGRPFLAMKYIEGQTLTDLLDHLPVPSPDLDRFLHIFDEVCQTVAYVHAKGVIHRDLTTNNVLVSTRGRVCVIDWGLSKVVGTHQEPPQADDALKTDGTAQVTVPNLCDTGLGVALGTPAFIPPEQAIGRPAKASMRSDVFGLGSILCYILTGLPPYSGPATSVMVQAKNGDARAAYDRLDASNAPPELVDLAKRCLSRNAVERPANAGVVAREIEAYRARQKPMRRSWWAKLFHRTSDEE